MGPYLLAGVDRETDLSDRGLTLVQDPTWHLNGQGAARVRALEGRIVLHPFQNVVDEPDQHVDSLPTVEELRASL